MKSQAIILSILLFISGLLGMALTLGACVGPPLPAPSSVPSVAAPSSDVKKSAERGLGSNEKTRNGIDAAEKKAPEVAPELGAAREANTDQNKAFREVLESNRLISAQESEIKGLVKSNQSLSKRIRELESEQNSLLSTLRNWTLFVSSVVFGVSVLAWVFGKLTTIMPAVIALGAMLGVFFLDAVIGFRWWIGGVTLVGTVGVVAYEMWVRGRSAKELVQSAQVLLNHVDETASGTAVELRQELSKVQSKATKYIVNRVQGKTGFWAWVGRRLQSAQGDA